MRSTYLFAKRQHSARALQWLKTNVPNINTTDIYVTTQILKFWKCLNSNIKIIKICKYKHILIYHHIRYNILKLLVYIYIYIRAIEYSMVYILSQFGLLCRYLRHRLLVRLCIAALAAQSWEVQVRRGPEQAFCLLQQRNKDVGYKTSPKFWSMS